MKTLKLSFLLLMLVFGFWACDQSEEDAITLNDQLSTTSSKGMVSSAEGQPDTSPYDAGSREYYPFDNVIGDFGGLIYGVHPNGGLLFYKDLRMDGTNGYCGQQGWHANSGKQVGCGWTGFKHLFSGGNGVIYGIKQTGELMFYKDLSKDGTNGACGQRGWHPNSGKQIGCGWSIFKQVISAGNGVIYGVKDNGELMFYKDLKQDGTNGACGQQGWHVNSGKQIGCGWNGVRLVSGGSGVIYAIKSTGELLFFKDLRMDGTNGACGQQGWHFNSGKQIGYGWNGLDYVFSGNNRTIYGIKSTGELLFYKDLKQDGTNGPAGQYGGWHTNSGRQIGCGWNAFF